MDAATAQGGAAGGRERKWGKDADGGVGWGVRVGERRTGIPRRANTDRQIIRNTRGKQNGTDKQEKNRKPVNQGKSYR